MAKLDPSQNPYYPSAQKTGELHDEFRMLFAHMHESRQQIADLTARLDAAHNRIGEMQKSSIAQTDPGGPSTTKIAGINVRGVPPTDGDRLTYDAGSNQITWKP